MRRLSKPEIRLWHREAEGRSNASPSGGVLTLSPPLGAAQGVDQPLLLSGPALAAQRAASAAARLVRLDPPTHSPSLVPFRSSACFAASAP